jgi:hypothetical protein
VGIIKLFSARESLISDILAGDGKIVRLLYSVSPKKGLQLTLTIVISMWFGQSEERTLPPSTNHNIINSYLGICRGWSRRTAERNLDCPLYIHSRWWSIYTASTRIEVEFLVLLCRCTVNILRSFDQSPAIGLTPSIQSHSPLCILYSTTNNWARIFKRLCSPGIDSKEEFRQPM